MKYRSDGDFDLDLKRYLITECYDFEIDRRVVVKYIELCKTLSV